MAQKLYPQMKILKETEQIDIASKVYNLEGSIFKWANEGRELVDCNNTKTPYCHPYSVIWGRLLEPNLRVYKPGAKI